MTLGAENEYQEFKESLSQLDKGIKSLTAMLNRNGSGTVYFGVDDNGKIIGLTIGKKTLLDIRARLKDIVEPHILATIEECCHDGKQYIKLSATGSDIPYSCDGRYYVRNVSADEKVSNHMLRKMLSAGDADIIRQIAADNQQLTFNQFFSILSKNKIHPRDTKEFYQSFGLLNHKKEFNYLAYLLSDQNTISIKLVTFAGNDKSTLSERTEFGHQCLLLSAEQMLLHIKSLNATRADLSEGIRQETSLFSFDAFREAWINACLHNTWSEYIPPAVYLFDNRLEIISYGGLPYGLTKDGFFNGTSLPINRSLLTIFISTGFAEQSGHGVPIIVSHYGKEAFDFENGLLKVTIKFAFESTRAAIRTAFGKSQHTLTTNQQKLYRFLSENPSSTLSKASAQLDISLSGVKKITAKLQEMGLLKREGSKKNGKWLIKST